MKRSGNRIQRTMRMRRRAHASGVALFLAISLLALFSVLGASYMRFMSIELDDSDMRIRQMRARQYAAAGVNSAAGNIAASLAADRSPDGAYVFLYPLYDGRYDVETNTPTALTAYTAEARVAVAHLDQDGWQGFFPDGPSWPGPDRAFHVVSIARVQQAVPGQMRTLATHAVEAVMLGDADGCDTVFWRRFTGDAPDNQE